MTALIFRDPIAPGDRYSDGSQEVVIARLVEHGGAPRKIWYRRPDSRAFTYGIVETWQYEEAFLASFRKVGAL